MSVLHSNGRIAWIDGLRAIAVVSVILYHLDPYYIGNGLLGVDVFFVISGFVVCRTLLLSKESGNGSLFVFISGFYKRRAWRLLPALLTVVSATFVLVFFVVPPAYLSSQIFFTGLASIGGVANISLMLARGTNYFSQMAGYNPFLHTWSLGVEEQFYLLFPIILWIISVRKNKHFPAIPFLCAICFASFAWAEIYMLRDPTVAFYSPFSRLWELSAGAIIFLLTKTNRLRGIDLQKIYPVICSLALILLLASFFQPASFASPLPAAILPVIATSLFLWAGANVESHKTFATQVLSIGVITYVGRISYSLYLWHWPVVVMMRWTIGFEQTWQILLAALLSFVFGVLSYHLIEQTSQRFGSSVKLPAKFIFAPLAAVVITYSATVLAVGNTRGFRYTMPSLSVVGTEPGWHPWELPVSGRQKVEFPDDGRSKLFVVGDSHAGSIAGATIASANMAKMAYGNFGGCAFNLLRPISDFSGCLMLKRASAGDVVLFSALNLPRYIDQHGSEVPQPDHTSRDSRAQRAEALEQFQTVVADLRARGVGVIIRGPEPLFRYIPFRCADRFTMANVICSNPTYVPRDELLQIARPAWETMQAVQNNVPGVILLDVFSILCPEERCEIFDENGNPLFLDQDHLSGWGNEVLFPAVLEALYAALRTVPAGELGKI